MESFELQLYKDIKTDCYYSVKTIVEDYCVDINQEHIYFASEQSSFRVFKYLYYIALKNKIKIDCMKLLCLSVSNKEDNQEIFLFLVKNSDKDFNTNIFSVNCLFFLHKQNKQRYFKEVVKILKDNNVFEDVLKKIEIKYTKKLQIDILKLIKLNNKIENF